MTLFFAAAAVLLCCFLLRGILRLTNRRKNEKIPDGIITDQRNVKGRYGLFGMPFNGCEVIAVHNAKLLSGRNSSLAKTADGFYKSGAIALFGLFGSYPRAIGRVLKKEGVSARRVTAKETAADGVYIASYWNAHKPFFGLHTVAFTRENGTLTVCNGSVSELKRGFESAFICAYRIEKKIDKQEKI